MIRPMNVLWCSMTAVLLIACGGANENHGPGTPGTQTQYATATGRLTSDTSSSTTASSQFDSTGTLAAATSVQASTIGTNGALQVVGQGSINSNGQYSVQVPASETHLILQALDAKAHVLASAVLESSGNIGSTVVVTPMTAQSSVEAAVLVQMVVQGAPLDSISTLDLSQRIDANTAASIRAMAEAGANVQAEVTALAQASIAAQSASLDSMAQAGIQLTGQALFQDELSFAQSIASQLNDGSETVTQAQVSSQIAAMLSSLGVTSMAQSQATAASSAVFRGVLDSQVGASSSDQALLTAASLTEASLEAQSSSTAEVSLLTNAGGSQAMIQSALAAGTTLQTQVSAATSISAAAQAFVSFQATIAAETQSNSNNSLLGQLLGSELGGNANVSTDLQALLGAEAQAAATFDASLAVAFQASAQSNLTSTAQTVASAYATFSASVQAQAQQILQTIGASQTTLVADLLVVADGSFAASTSAH